MSETYKRGGADPGITTCGTPWPLIVASDAILDTNQRARVNRLADTLAMSPPVRRARHYAAAFEAENVHAGWVPGPTLWVEDHRGIELVGDRVARGFEYRSLGLAREGDTLLVSGEREHDFERYLRETLALGAPQVQRVKWRDGSARSLCGACLDDNAMLAHLVSTASDAGCFNLMPYRSDGHGWELARQISREASVPAYIGAPVPPLARAANDKLWFASTARRLLGSDASPPTWSAQSPAAAAARLARLAASHERLVLKTPASAGALGNVVIDAEALRERRLDDVRARIIASVAEIGWSGPWPLLVGVWEAAAYASPSVQMWIPPVQCGEPQVEGLYEQRLVGDRGIFVGATEAGFETPLRQRLECEALMLALLLQRLGYVGRASFDALLVGTDRAAPHVHWIECNARWGGVSIPMCVLSRLGLRCRERGTLIAQLPIDANATTFARLLKSSASLKFDRNTHGGIIWLTPPCCGRHGVDFVAVGENTAAGIALGAELCALLDVTAPDLAPA